MRVRFWERSWLCFVVLSKWRISFDSFPVMLECFTKYFKVRRSVDFVMYQSKGNVHIMQWGFIGWPPISPVVELLQQFLPFVSWTSCPAFSFDLILLKYMFLQCTCLSFACGDLKKHYNIGLIQTGNKSDQSDVRLSAGAVGHCCTAICYTISISS